MEDNSLELTANGVYAPAFLRIQLPKIKYNNNWDQMTDDDFGVFFHEYVHYLQNITTIRGIKESQFYWDKIFEILHIITNSPTINIPIDNTKDIIKEIDRKLTETSGTCPFLNDSSFEYSLDSEKKQVLLKFDGTKPILGSKIIKESMAYECQKLVNPTYSTHYSCPYRVVELLANKINPSLVCDKLKLIAICLLSLNSLYPGFKLIELLEESNNYRNLDALEYYREITEESTVVFNNERITIANMYNISVDSFKESFYQLPLPHSNYFDILFKSLKNTYNSNTHPLLICLSEFINSTDKNRIYLKNLLEVYGLPIIIDNDYQPLIPLSQQNEHATSFVFLFIFEAVLKRIIAPIQNNGICILKNFCDTNPEFSSCTSESCYENPWENKNYCPFRAYTDYMNFNKKEIINNS